MPAWPTRRELTVALGALAAGTLLGASAADVAPRRSPASRLMSQAEALQDCYRSLGSYPRALRSVPGPAASWDDGGGALEYRYLGPDRVQVLDLGQDRLAGGEGAAADVLWDSQLGYLRRVSPAELRAAGAELDLGAAAVALLVGLTGLGVPSGVLALGLLRAGRSSWVSRLRGRLRRRRLEARGSPRRCAYCHGGAGGRPLLPCESCATALHPECWGAHQGCPTPGCPAAPDPRARAMMRESPPAGAAP